MPIKTWSGLGDIGSPTDGTDQTSRSVVKNPDGTTGVTVTVDHTVRSPLDQNPLPDIDPNKTPPGQVPIGQVGVVVVFQPPFVIDPNANPQIFSSVSPPAPYSTLFDDFQLVAYPTYNFWTADERTNDQEDRGNRQLSDIPRYIHVYWQPAPDLSNLPRLGIAPSVTKGVRNISPVKLGAEAEKPLMFDVKGVQFVPDHLQPQNFSLGRKSTINGYLGPGVIDAVVELPLHNAGFGSGAPTPDRPAEDIDEEVFLTHDDTQGLSFHELVGNVFEVTNGVLGAERLSKQSISPGAQADHSQFFDGKFSVSESPRMGDPIHLGGIQSSSPALSVDVRPCLSSEGDQPDHVFDVAEAVSQPPPPPVPNQSYQARAKFIDPAIGGAIDPRRVNLMTRPEHAESMIALAHALPNLEVLSLTGFAGRTRAGNIPSFPSPAGLTQLQYTGYVLEKFARTDQGAFVKVQEIELPSPDYTEYIDTRVLYGEVYRYRIRSIARWTRPKNVGPFGPESGTIDQPGSNAKSVAPFKSSYLAGEWSRTWAYGMLIDNTPPDPPDELRVDPQSSRGRIEVTFRLPNNPQRDIFRMRLLRKLQDSDGNDLTPWIQVSTYDSVNRGVDFAPQNVLFYDTDVDFYELNHTRYVYSAQSVSRHGEVSVLSEQLGARLSRDYRGRGEFPVIQISCAGVRPEHFGSFAVWPPRKFRGELIIRPLPIARDGTEQPSAFTATGRERLSNRSMAPVVYAIRVESLDTGERQTYLLSTAYNNMPDRVVALPTDAAVPSLATRRVDIPDRPAATQTIGTTSVVPSEPMSPLDRTPPGRRGIVRRR